MYARDMPIIRDHALSSPDGLADVVIFVLLTIQQKFDGVQSQVADVRKTKAKSKYLFGSKRDGYRYVQSLKASLHRDAVRMVASGDVAGLVELFTHVPGLGVVKAGFVAQCLGMNVACIDTHNLARCGFKETEFKLDKKLTPKTRRAKIDRYIAFCQEAGAAYWWNSWCDYVGGLYDKLGDGDTVSAHHVTCVFAH